MALQQAIEYLHAHSDVPRDVLREKLRNAGYPSYEISRAETFIDGDEPPTPASVGRRRVYRTGEFFLGIIAAWILNGILLDSFFDEEFGLLLALGIFGLVAWRMWHQRPGFVVGMGVVNVMTVLFLMLFWF